MQVFSVRLAQQHVCSGGTSSPAPVAKMLRKPLVIRLISESLQIDVFLNVFLVNTPRFQFPLYCTKTCRNHTSRNVCHKTTVINGAEALKAFLNPTLD